MFTGIVESLGTVTQARKTEQGLILSLKTGFSDLALGESVSVNGVCLTVTECTSSGDSQYFVSSESLRCTQLGALANGDTVNLERAMAANGRFSGHVVQGHVDAVGEVISASPRGDAWHFEVRVPISLRRFVVEKGSIALNGVSLTVNAIRENDRPADRGDRHDDPTPHAGKSAHFVIEIMLIPHTWEHTNLSRLKSGAPINVEVDILAKYILQNIPALQTPEVR